ncbi:DUF998 domain-containing protein [Anaeromicropila herbilytica]|uniref:Membrane protein n=1 Tax=Anaeromicropila herbilytica TaxID=2785025 RepID=A0A7R7EJG5_9FIRM|nr:DUF998 domain-containing protein [Anaeromicropila herbilytica]BCN29874.1 membrane protein [Anaeromicropila herbilytica]
MKNNKWFLFVVVISLTDCILPFFLALFYLGYNYMNMVLSALGSEDSPVRAIYNIWMLCLGVSFIFIGLHVYRSYESVAKYSRTCLLLITLGYAVFDCINSGFFSIGDSKNMVTIPQMIHGYGSVIGCTLFTFSGLIAAVMLWKSYRNAALLLLLDFIVCLLAFTIFVASENIGADSNGIVKIMTYEGLWQRISFLFMYVPHIVLCMITLRKKVNLGGK